MNQSVTEKQQKKLVELAEVIIYAAFVLMLVWVIYRVIEYQIYRYPLFYLGLGITILWWILPFTVPLILWLKRRGKPKENKQKQKNTVIGIIWFILWFVGLLTIGGLDGWLSKNLGYEPPVFVIAYFLNVFGLGVVAFIVGRVKNGNKLLKNK